MGSLKGNMNKPNGLHNGTVDISKPLTEILIMILKYQTNDALLLSRQLIGFAQFAKGGYFKNHSANLGHVLEKLFTSVIVIPDREWPDPPVFSLVILNE